MEGKLVSESKVATMDLGRQNEQQEIFMSPAKLTSTIINHMLVLWLVFML
jgi:hypothetical protein